MQLEETFKQVKRASKRLALLTDQQRNEILLAVAKAITVGETIIPFGDINTLNNTGRSV